MKYKLLQIFGVLFCGSAVVLGAFGAHLLSDMLSADALQSFEVGVRYQFFHGLALLFLSLSPGSKKGHVANCTTLCNWHPAIF